MGRTKHRKNHKQKSNARGMRRKIARKNYENKMQEFIKHIEEETKKKLMEKKALSEEE